MSFKELSSLKGNCSEVDCLLKKYHQIEHKIKYLAGNVPRNGSMKVVILKLEQFELKREIQKFLGKESDIANSKGKHKI